MVKEMKCNGIYKRCTLFLINCRQNKQANIDFVKLYGRGTIKICLSLAPTSLISCNEKKSQPDATAQPPQLPMLLMAAANPWNTIFSTSPMLLI